MPLIDLKTDLKLLKYGNDRPGGGSSDQPYIQTDINRVDTGFNRLRLTRFDDGLIRGGIIGATNSSVVDAIRIGKFLTDAPKGPLFIAKQIGLQLSNPRLETRKLNDGGGGGILGGLIRFANNVSDKLGLGPTRIYNLGINTLAQVPVNAFGIHFNRHGLLPIQNENTKYLSVAQNNNTEANNRLTGLRNRFSLGYSADPSQGNIRLRRRESRILNNLAGLSSLFFGTDLVANRIYSDIQSTRIDDYIGGPNSVYGIGRTLIRRTPEFTNDIQRIEEAKNRRYASQTIPSIKINQTFDYGLSTYTTSSLSANSFVLNSGSAIANGSFQNIIASKNDPADSRYVAADQEASASQRIKSFTSLSNYTSSVFSSDPFPGLNNNIPPTLANYVASKNDPKDNKYIASGSEANASAKMRVPNAFVGASIYSTSSFAPDSFPKLTSSTNPENKPTTLDNQIASNYTTSLSPGSLQEANSIGKGNNAIFNYDNSIPIDENGIKQGVDQTVVFYSNSSAKTYSELQKRVKYVTDGNRGTIKINGIDTDVNKFKIYGEVRRGANFTYLTPQSTDYPIYNNGKETVRINIPWNLVHRDERIGSGRQDEINLTPIFETAAGTIGDKVNIPGAGSPKNINDLVKFRIQALNGDNPSLAKWMIFRAYLTQLTDNTDATWNSVKYAGRGEDFYVYGGFSRKIQIGFKVAALSADEMRPMYQKLNFLMGNVMPDYTENGLMRGPMIKMTIGNWIDGQDGILNSVAYTVSNDSPWEIGLGSPSSPLILPHIVEVNLSFTPIGSQTGASNLASAKSTTISHIAQDVNERREYVAGEVKNVPTPTKTGGE